MQLQDLLLLSLLGALCVCAASPLTPLAKWSLPTQFGPQSKFDHMWLDAASDSFYVCAKGIGHVLQLNATSGALLHAVSFVDPQGVALTNGLLWVGSGNGSLIALDPSTLAPKINFPFFSDTDDLKLAASGRLFAASGDLGSGGFKHGQAAIVEIAAESGQPVVLNHTDVDGHVEGFAVVPNTRFVVASTPDTNHIHVLDADTQTITNTWTVPAPFSSVVPLVFDEASQTILAVARSPGALVVLDYANGGKLLASVACDCTDADDIWLASSSTPKMVFISSGRPAPGVISAFTQQADGTYALLGTSSPGGKTSLLDEASHRLFVAVPSTATEAGFIQVYSLN